MISRRTLLALLPFGLATAGHAASEHPAVAFMNKLGGELLHAHRLGTASALSRVIARYADIPAIAKTSLGSNELPDGEEERYRRGMINYISRVMAYEGQNYPVAKYEVGEPQVDHDKNVVVQSKVYLMAGQQYTVSWQLNWVSNTYKVADVTVLGFSMVSRQKEQFQDFIKKYGVPALIDRLNNFR